MGKVFREGAGALVLHVGAHQDATLRGDNAFFPMVIRDLICSVFPLLIGKAVSDFIAIVFSIAGTV